MNTLNRHAPRLWSTLSSVLVLAALAGLWHGAVKLEWVSPIFLPSPAATLDAIREGLQSGDLLALTEGWVWAWAH